MNGSDTIIDNSTAVPIRTQVFETANDEVLELTASELAEKVKGQVRE